MTIRDRLKQERERLNFFRSVDFAQQCRLPEKMVIAWEEGKSFPDAPALERMAEAGADVYYVLTGRVGPRNEEESDLMSAYQRCWPDVQRSLRDRAEKEARTPEEIEQEARDANFDFLKSITP